MTHDEILDELAKRGLIDGNIVERLSAAHRRELEEREHVAEEHATEHAEGVARDNCRIVTCKENNDHRNSQRDAKGRYMRKTA